MRPLRVTSRRNTRSRLAIVAAISLVLATSCGGDDEPAETANRAIEVMMSDLAFEPPEIRMVPGERIELRLANHGSMEHDFTVDQMPLHNLRMTGGGAHGGHHGEGAGLHMALAQDNAGSLSFEPSEAGRFEYYCTVEGHREAGMRGTLIVES